jgi:hypothetical protein
VYVIGAIVDRTVHSVRGCCHHVLTASSLGEGGSCPESAIVFLLVHPPFGTYTLATLCVLSSGVSLLYDSMSCVRLSFVRYAAVYSIF